MADQKNEFDSLDEMTSQVEEFEFDEEIEEDVHEGYEQEDFDDISSNAQDIIDNSKDDIEESTSVSNSSTQETSDDDVVKEKNFFQKNLVLIIMGSIIIPVLAYFAYWMTTPPVNQNAPVTARSDGFNLQGSQFGSQQVQAPSLPKNDTPLPVEESIPKEIKTVIQGVSEDDVLEIVEPLVEQIKKMSSSINDINKYLNEQESKIVEAKFGENDLKVIKEAINAGLDSTEKFLLNKIDEQNKSITDISERLKSLEYKKQQFEARKPLTMITASEGKALMKITGSENEFSIVNGESLKGYGRILRVGPWGCLHLSTGEKVQPENASCDE